MRRLRLLVLALLGSLVLGGCGIDVYKLPLPGGTDVGDDPMTVHIMFWAVLVMIGSFFRGPGINFTLPWSDGLFFEL